MKTFFTRLLLTSVMLVATVSLQAQGDEYKILFDVGFEDGRIPDGWEVVNEHGDDDWKIVSGDSYGSSGRHIALRNGTSVQKNYRTLLVAPAVDVSTAYQPIVLFAHRQRQWTGDVDTLRVLYRTSAEKEWTELARFGNAVDGWKMDTLFLNDPGTTYQVAFEGSDNMGGGIELDNICVRSYPRCEQPSNFQVNGLANDSCVIGWYAGFEGEEIIVKVSMEELSPEQLDGEEISETVVLDTVLPGNAIEMPVRGLTAGTDYFVYIRTVCPNERSDWSEGFTFSTTNLVDVPYYEDFNLPYQAGYNNRVPGWSWGTSTDGYSPLINTATETGDLHYYSRDASTALCFVLQNADAIIPGGYYSYAATPQMNVDRIQDLQVTFEARYQYNPGDIHKIILGVMTDSKNYGSFIPVDTFECIDKGEFYTFSALLDNYEGDGKYIALASDFDEDNRIYIDNFKVEYAGDCKAPINVELKVPSAAELEITWDDYGAEKADIVLTKKFVNLSADPKEEGDTVKLITGVPTGKPYTIRGLTPWEEYYVYVRNDNGIKSPWSIGKYVHMPEKMMEESLFINFDIDEKDSSTWYKNPWYEDLGAKKMCRKVMTLYLGDRVTCTPEVINSNYTSTTYPIKSDTPWELKLSVGAEDHYSAAIFPEIENIREYRVRFWQNAYSTADNGEDRYLVGIMSDALDISTFYPLDTFSVVFGFNQYTVEFDKYPETMDGKFFAIMIPIELNQHVIAQATSTTLPTARVYIDNLIFEKIPECREPYYVEILSTTDGAEMNWKKYADAYNIRISADTLTAEKLSDLDTKYAYSQDNITTLPLTVKGLDQGVTYTYSIQPVCGGKPGSWTEYAYFTTECSDKTPLPYKQNFDELSYAGSSKQVRWQLPCVWTKVETHVSSGSGYTSTSYYPNIYTGSKYNGDASVYLHAGSTSNYPDTVYLAFPSMDVDTVTDLQLTFAMKPGSMQAPLQVGVMTDPEDTSTFTMYREVYATQTSAFEEFVIPFDQYKGKGRHIALLAAPKTSTYFIVDSVVIERIKCAKATGLEVLGVTANSVDLTWTDGNPGSWDLVISTEPLTSEQLDKAVVGSDGVVFSENVAENPYAVTEGIKENTKYWFYVRGVCSGEDKASWPFKAGEFRTGCRVLDCGDGSLQTFDNDGTGVDAAPGCWTVGSPKADAVENPSATIKGYIPYCSDEYRHGGKASLRFFSNKSYDGAYAISPQLNVEDIRNVDVTFWASTTESRSNPEDYAAKIVVGVVSSPYDLSTFVPLDTVQAYGDEQLFRVRMDEYMTDEGVDGGKYAMFLSEFGMNNYFYIDDVRFDETGQCAVPVDLDTVVPPTMSGIELKWRGGSAPYTVVYSDRQLTEDELNGGEGTVVHNDVQATKAEITGLESLTTYYVYVKSGCEGGGWSAPLRVRTECKDVYSLPYYDNFDHNQYTGSGNQPVCWNCSYSSAAYPQVSSTGFKGKSIYLYTSKTAASYAVSPELDVENASDCYVSFYAKSNVSTKGHIRNLIIGLVEDVADRSTIEGSFHPVDTITLKAEDGFTKYVVPLFSGIKGKHVGFTSSYDLNINDKGATVAGGAYIDEVEIDLFKPCPTPDFIVVNTVTDTELKGTFEEMGDATAWQAVCVESGKDVSTGTPTPLTGQEFSFSGLTPRTGYDIYVRAACAEGVDGYTKWRGPYTVRTTNVPERQLPFETGFEVGDESNGGWDFASDVTNHWHIGNAIGHESQGGLYITDDGGVTSRYNAKQAAVSWIYRTMELIPGEYTVEYDWTCYGESSRDFIKIGFMPTNIQMEAGIADITYGDGSRFTIGGLVTGTPAEWISLEGLDDNHEQLYKLNLSDTVSADIVWTHNKADLTIEEGGIYNLVILWMNDKSTGLHPSPAAVIDNLSVRQSSCIKPENLRVEKTSSESTTVAWDTKNDEAAQWEVFVTDNADLYTPDYATEGDTVRCDTVDMQSCLIDNLEEWGISHVFVRSICPGNRCSQWSEKITFRTECSDKPLGTVFGFDDESTLIEEPEYGGSYDLHPMCFAIGHSQGVEITKNTGDVFPYLKESDNSRYARSGANSLYFNNSNADEAGGYIALPAFDTESLAGMQITFWMRPIYYNTVNKKMQATGNLGSTYARSLTVGSMTDPYDFSTFRPIEVVVYPYTNSEVKSTTLVTDDPNETEWWRQYTVVLPEDCGRYIVLWNGTDYGKAKNAMYVDDIKVGPVPDCAIPSNINVTDVRSSSANVEFTPINADAETRWVLHLSTKTDMSDTAECDTLATIEPYPLEELTQNTDYFIKIKQLCAEGEESGWSPSVQFRTPLSIPFYETFERAVRVPDGWQRSNSCKLEDLLNGTEGLNNLDDTYTGWVRMGATAYASAHQYVNISNDDDRWIVTPVIDMGEMDDAKLTFDLAVTAEDSYLPAGRDFMDLESNCFAVIVSDDNGSTWKRENATIWNNTGDGEHVYSQLSNAITKIEIDMGKYAGKSVKVAFYAGNAEPWGVNLTNYVGDVHIDNVRINSLLNIPLVDDVCETYSYNRYGFSRHYDELSPGVHEMTRFAMAADESEPDTIYDLTLSVNSLSRTYLTDSVCEGDMYTRYNFSTDAGGLQKQKFSFADGKCDSVVYLDLKVIPIPASVTPATICQGQKYQWNGREIDRSGVYTDTVQAVSCECDSVATLVLTVTEAEVTPVEVTVCHDGEYEFGGQKLTESCVVRDTVTDASECMSITELTLTVLPDYRRGYTAYFCEGSEYTDENFIGVTEAGTYTNPLISVVGECDSTITLTLIALGGDTVRASDTVSVDELPYTIDGTDITYDAGTEPGTYTDTVLIEAGECSDVLIHTLVVDDVSAFGHADVKVLTLTPNPVRVHESVMVHLELTQAEREGLTVQVFSSTGGLMRQFSPYGDPIVIDGFDAAGVYVVRMVDGSGNVYTGKVVVR